MGFKIASSGDFQTRNFGALAILVHVWVVLWHHKGVSKPMGFKIASSGDFQNSQFGAPAILVQVFPKLYGHAWVLLQKEPKNPRRP